MLKKHDWLQYSASGRPLAMKIGLLSDTHGHLEPTIPAYFEDCDEIWHAGDIGENRVLESLQQLKSVKAVFGNIDTQAFRSSLPEDLWMTYEGVTIWMTHIGGAPPNYNPRVKRILKERKPAIFICGHSHILKVVRDPVYNLLYINPGAAGNHGFHAMKTMMRFELLKGELKNVEVIELGKRGYLGKE